MTIVDIPKQTAHTDDITTAGAAVGRWQTAHGIPAPASTHNITTAGAAINQWHAAHHGQHYSYINAQNSSPFDFVTTGNGEQMMIPKSQAADYENPIHVQKMGSTPPQTPGYFRLLSPLLATRYITMRLTDGIFDMNAPETMAGIDPNSFEGMRSKLACYIKNYQTEKLNTIVEGVEKLWERVNISEMSLEELKEGNNVESLFTEAGSNEMHPELAHALHEVKSVGIVNGSKSALLDYAEQYHENPSNWQRQKNDLEKRMEKIQRGTTMDTLLGITNAIGTGYYAHRVYKDIEAAYTETVAYETAKDPKDINIGDIFTAKNKIVAETRNNYLFKNLARTAIDICFFGRHIMHGIGNHSMEHFSWGDFAMGLKAFSLVVETQRRETSMFIDITSLINNKLTPDRGISSQINSSDLINLYQKYWEKHDTTELFADATRHDIGDNKSFRLLQLAFGRMADLMNKTYKYKHDVNNGLEPAAQIEQDILDRTNFFTLPKFLGLLGEDRIKASDPYYSLALAEIANRYGMQAVEQLATRVEKGERLVDALEIYPVDLEQTFGDIGPEYAKISAKSREIDNIIIRQYLDEHPEVKHNHDRLLEETLTPSTQSSKERSNNAVSTIVNTGQLIEESESKYRATKIPSDTNTQEEQERETPDNLVQNTWHHDQIQSNDLSFAKSQ